MKCPYAVARACAEPQPSVTLYACTNPDGVIDLTGETCPALVDFQDGICQALKTTRERAEALETMLQEWHGFSRCTCSTTLVANCFHCRVGRLLEAERGSAGGEA